MRIQGTNVERVTVSLPADLLLELDRRSKNRSAFVQEAVLREIGRRVRLELLDSGRNPHPETLAYAGESLDEWATMLPKEDTTKMYDPKKVTPLRWIEGKGWKRG